MSFESHSGNNDIFASGLEDTGQSVIGYLKTVEFQKSKFGKDQPVMILINKDSGDKQRVVTAGSLIYTALNIAIGMKILPYVKEDHEKNLDNIKKDKALFGKLIRITHAGRFKNKAGQAVHKFKVDVDQSKTLEAFEEKLKAEGSDQEDTFNHPSDTAHIPF